jgi:hypothetical protein
MFRNAQFVSAVVFLLMAVSFTFGDNGVWWTWSNTPVVGAILVAVSLVFWVLFARRAMKVHRSRSES